MDSTQIEEIRNKILSIRYIATDREVGPDCGRRILAAVIDIETILVNYLYKNGDLSKSFKARK